MMWTKAAAIAATIVAVLILKPILGDDLANVVMWGIAGIKLGDWAHQLAQYLEAKYG